jgi:hypothetical protein
LGEVGLRELNTDYGEGAIMSMVPDADNLRPRIVPKVFADVPSASELALARSQTAAARSSRNVLVVVSVLLVGMLIASAAGLVYFEGQARELPAQITDRDEQITKLQKDAADSAAALTAQRKAHEEAIAQYTVIDQRLKKTDELRASIRAVLQEKPGAAAVRKPALGSPNSPISLESSVWLELRNKAEEGLAAEATELEKLEADVKAWKPPVGAGQTPFGD